MNYTNLLIGLALMVVLWKIILSVLEEHGPNWVRFFKFMYGKKK